MTHITLMGGTFNLFDEHCDGQNGLHTHFARQLNRICNGVARCEQAFIHTAQEQDRNRNGERDQEQWVLMYYTEMFTLV